MDDADNGLSLACVPNGKNGTATITACLGDEVLAVETMNVTRSKARDAFLNKVCKERPGIDRAALEGHLLRLAADLAAKGGPAPEAAETSGRDSAADLLAKTPESVRAEARTLLDSPDLLQKVLGDIATLGVAGEKELAATVYLIGTSRLLPEPLAAIVQGPSSSGKSYVVRKVASLIPPEGVITATQLSPQSLFYMKPGSLVHRFIVAGERSRLENDDSAEATRALREMLSEGRLSKLLPIKKDGQLESILVEQDGPIAYIESTTLTELFAEDANRCILLSSDERPEQTRRILSTLASTYAKGAGGDRQRIIDRHHALQRMLQPHTVVVPFAEALADAMGNHRVEARRAFPQVVSMIQALALLHQHRRQVDADGRLLAHADDYHLARHLLGQPMARQLGGRLSGPAVRFLERLREWFNTTEVFTTRDARGRETRSKSSVYGWLAELHEAGMVDQVETARGNQAARWRLSPNAPDPDAAAVLPPAERVCS
ncbi:MAG: hypothetical protein JW809_19250 [Pirellulales bacterium]|nr:hypothetical protein [Pirellulales bacterium]